MSGSLSPERRKLYIQAQDISDAPQWAIDLAARRRDLTTAEKAACAIRLREEYGWTYAKVARLFGLTDAGVRSWVLASTDEGKARMRDLAEARSRRDPYAAARYFRGYHDRRRHGPGSASARVKLWQEQDGLCYLCKDPLGPDRMAVIDHDHRCCPPGYSCEICRRGLACRLCNWIAGYAFDDPDRLERIAANLRCSVASVTERMKDAEAS